jgi:hypothetical protein
MPEWDLNQYAYSDWEWLEAQRRAEEEARRRATEEVRQRAESARRLQSAMNSVITVTQPEVPKGPRWDDAPLEEDPYMVAQDIAAWVRPQMPMALKEAPKAPQPPSFLPGAGAGAAPFSTYTPTAPMAPYRPQETPQETQRFQQGIQDVLGFLKEETAPARERVADWWERMQRPWSIDPRETGADRKVTGTPLKVAPNIAANIYRDVFGNLVVPKGSTTSPIGKEAAQALGMPTNRGAAIPILGTQYEIPLPFITDQGLYSYTSQYSKLRQWLDETPQRALEVGRRFVQPIAQQGWSMSRRSLEGDLTDQEIEWLRNMTPAERKRMGERTGIYLPEEAPALTPWQETAIKNPSKPWFDFLPKSIDLSGLSRLSPTGPALTTAPVVQTPYRSEPVEVGIKGLAGLLRGPSWETLTERNWKGEKIPVSPQAPTSLQEIYPEINDEMCTRRPSRSGTPMPRPGPSWPIPSGARSSGKTSRTG